MSELINNREHRKETPEHPVHTFLLENAKKLSIKLMK